MRYKNTKTGAIVDSSFAISGKYWEVFSKEEATKEKPEEYVDEEVNLEEMTNKELEAFAKEHKIELSYNDKRNKESLINAIAKAFE